MNVYKKYQEFLSGLSDHELLSLSGLLHTTACRRIIFNRNYDKIKLYMTGAEMEALNNYFNKNMILSEAGAGYKLNMDNVSKKLKNTITEHIL